MVTLQQAAQQALETLTMYQDFIKKGGLTFRHGEEAITTLRQALEADAKPCACCGDGKASISVTRVCDTCGSEYAGQAEMDLAKQVKRQPLTDELQDAFFEGFCAVETYNDTRLNSVEDEWEKYKTAHGIK